MAGTTGRSVMVLAIAGLLAATGCTGEQGPPGTTAMVNVAAEDPGDNCEAGGQRIDVGLDTNENGTLDDDEITDTQYVCSGRDGVDGEDGADGADGADGRDGRDGADGRDGVDGTSHDALVEVSDEPPGENCEFGGQRIDTGEDDNDDGVLDEAEIDSTGYICNACTEDCDIFVPVPQSTETEACLACHSVTIPALVDRWQHSEHYQNAVGCFECHEAEPGDVDAMTHNGFTISVIVSPLDCGECHDAEVAEFTTSHHAQAGQILDSLDNRLAEVVEGDLSFDGESPAAVMGCAYCHGSAVEVDASGRPTDATFPNSGIGRINPDGSFGSCSACHTRHDFASQVARRPDNCGRCHLGPDHPQMEVYTESQHGILYAANEDDMALDSDTWVVGEDYTAAPTCTTCHMGETATQASTHDVGLRLSWNLRAPISSARPDDAANRSRMQEVCMTCHSSGHVEGFYAQLDEGVNLYNDKFATPATDIYNLVRSTGLVSSDTFDDEIEWAYWYLWHHEGRRARTGMAMVGPDYVQWHGFYDIAERFYFELVPDAVAIAEEALADGDPENDADATAVLDLLDDILSRPEHTWFGYTRP